MTGPFDMPDMPRIEHALVDEETQMQRYLAEIAMEDIALLPDPSARRVRPGGLMEQYKRHVAAGGHWINPNAPVETISMVWTETGQPVEVEVTDRRDAVEFKGE